MGFMRKALFLGTGGLSGAAGVKANSKKERTAKALEKQLRLQRQMLKANERAQGAPMASPALQVGPRDPWLNEVAVALADLGLIEEKRNTDTHLEGVPIEGDIFVGDRKFLVIVTLFENEKLAHQGEMALRARPKIRDAVSKGVTEIRAVGQVLYVITGRGKTFDLARMQRTIESIGEIATPDPLSSGTQTASDSPLEQLRKLGELRAAGVLTDEEFESKKAELLGRI